jgi:hypothetical protein
VFNLTSFSCRPIFCPLDNSSLTNLLCCVSFFSPLIVSIFTTAEIVALVQRLKTQSRAVTFVDFNAALRMAGGDVGENQNVGGRGELATLYKSDGYHLNAAGDAVLSELLFDVIVDVTRGETNAPPQLLAGRFRLEQRSVHVMQHDSCTARQSN